MSSSISVDRITEATRKIPRNIPNFKSNVDGDISHNMKGDGRGDNGSTKIKGANPKTGVLFIKKKKKKESINL